MPGFTKRELKRMRKRLEEIYENLDGKKKQPEKGDGPEDEFTNMQNFISQKILELREKIEAQKKAEKKSSEYVTSLKLKKEMKEDSLQIEQYLASFQKTLQNILNSPKSTEKIRKERSIIYNRMEKIVLQLKQFCHGENVELDQPVRNALKLADFKNQDYNEKRLLTNEVPYGEENPEDDDLIKGWNMEEKKLDDRLEDVNTALEEMMERNRNLGDQIKIRDDLVHEANKDALETNKEISAQNKNLAEVLKKVRAPGKFCIDCCMIVLLIGLIGVIIALAVNGRL